MDMTTELTFIPAYATVFMSVEHRQAERLEQFLLLPVSTGGPMICRQSRRFLAAAALALVWILAIVTPSHAQSHLLYDSSHYDTPDVIYSLGSNPTGVHKIGVYYQSISSGNATKPYPNFPPDGLAIDDVQVSHDSRTESRRRHCE